MTRTEEAIIHETAERLTRYNLAGEIIATAERAPDGTWIITEPGSGMAVAAADHRAARQRLTTWEGGPAEKAREEITAAACRWRLWRQRLDQAIRDSAGLLPQAEIARITGFSRQWVGQIQKEAGVPGGPPHVHDGT